jgi:ubiquinone biosynthesis protein
MRRFVVEAVVDAAILAVLIVLLSLFHVPQPFPFGSGEAPILQFGGVGILGFVVAGAFVALSEHVVRPVVVAFTGRLLLSTLGLFVVIVNAIVLWAASLLAPDVGKIAQPALLWVLLFAALYTALSTVVGAVLGLNRPRMPGTGANVMWELLESLPTPRRNLIIENLRLQQIYDTVYAVALDSALARTPIAGFRRWFAARILREETFLEGATNPERLRIILQQLGPTYVKVGQMIASRGDVLPADVIAELSKLQSDAAPFPWVDAALMIKSELGREPDQLFASIEHEPFAAASTAQVHRATLHDGTLVAVKVQRPQIIAKTKADLGVMTELASIAERRIGIARKVGLRPMVAEFASGVLKELDYTNEAYHAKRLADNMVRFPEITVPHVYDDLSSSRVLTMDFISGIKVSNAQALRDAGFDTEALGAVFIRSVIKQILIDGFFHGDPHPGNLMAEPATKRLVFLDLGLMGQLKGTQRLDLLGLIYALKQIDIGGIADGLMALGKPTPEFDEEQFRTDVDRLARQYLVYGGVTSIGEALSGFMGAVFDNGLRLDSSLTLAIKAIIQSEETARVLAPDVDLAAEATREAQAALLESLEPDRVAKQVSNTAARIGKELARRTPTIEAGLLKWLDLVGDGKIKIELDTSDLSRSIDQVGGLGRQATVGLIVVGQLIGTAIAMSILLQPALAAYTGVAYAAMIAFAVTLVVSFVVLFRMLLGRGGPGG